jgi:uridine kinase
MLMEEYFLGSIITIAGASFAGKSTELEILKRDIMSEKNNEEASEYVWLSNSLEMTNFSTTLRDLSRILDKEYEVIFSGDFDQRAIDLANNYYEEKNRW